MGLSHVCLALVARTLFFSAAAASLGYITIVHRIGRASAASGTAAVSATFHMLHVHTLFFSVAATLAT
jgi:hypothetical protein